MAHNHSVVIKVTFGKSSFLFTGDLETAALETLLQTYSSSLLDIDILRVGHHGAANATTSAYLNATYLFTPLSLVGNGRMAKAAGNLTPIVMRILGKTYWSNLKASYPMKEMNLLS